MPEPHTNNRFSASEIMPGDLVQSYLDSLLREVSEVDEAGGAEAVPHFGGLTDMLVAVPPPAAVVVADIDVAEVDVAPAASAADNTPASVVVAETEPTALPDPRRVRPVPAWGQQGFAGLVFDVAGLKMAAPLHLLGGICLLEDNLQPVVAQADWFMGLLRWNGKNLRVVDTARFVMPERLSDNSHRAAYQSVIVLGDSHWALAVDKADESVHLQSAEIRWKTVIGNRPWLAGTLLERLCALIDVDTLLQMLNACDRTGDADTNS